MSYTARLQRDREEFIKVVSDESTIKDWYEARKLALLILRHALTYERIQVAWCNEEMSDRRTRYMEHREELLEKRIRAIVSELGLAGVTFSGDPRGATVKVLLPSGKTNDWGHEGYCVPIPEI